MDDELRENREAEQRAADLDHLGPAVGAGATIWARAAQDALALHESARARFEANTPDLEAWERFHSSAYMLVIAVGQVLAYAHRIVKLTGDAELSRARERFAAKTPHAEEFRHLVAHLDAYAIGHGWSQRPTKDGAPPLIAEKNLSVLPFWSEVSGTNIDLAGMRRSRGISRGSNGACPGG